MMEQSTATDNRPFRVILPKKSRLKVDFAKVMGTAGLAISKQNDRLDYGVVLDDQGAIAEFEALLQAADNALENIQDGLADMGVVGRDSFEEFASEQGSDCNLRIVHTFNNCAACAMWVATPDDSPISAPGDLKGKRIATSYPHLLKRWLAENGVTDVKVIARSGGIEDYVRLGLADAICDIVETGGTLVANGLTKRLKLFDSAAVLVERTGQWPDDRAEMAAKLRARLAAPEQVMQPSPASPAAGRQPAIAVA